MWECALLSLFLPGFGQARAGARAAAAGFAVTALLAHVAVIWTVWAVPASLAIHLAAAIDGGLRGRRSGTAHAANGFAVAAGVVTAAAMAAQYAAVEQYRAPSSSMVPALAVGDHFFVDRASTLWLAPQRGDVIVFVQPCVDRPYDKRVIGLPGDRVEVRCGVVYLNGSAVPREEVPGACSYDDLDEMTGTWLTRACKRYRETLGGQTYDVLANPETAPHDFPRDAAAPAPSCAEADGGSTPAADQAQGHFEVVTTAPSGACAQSKAFVVPADSLFVMGDNRDNSNDSRYWGVVPLGRVIGRVIGVVWPSGHGGRFGALR